MTAYICLHCNYKEYKQDAPPTVDSKSLLLSGFKESKQSISALTASLSAHPSQHQSLAIYQQQQQQQHLSSIGGLIQPYAVDYLSDLSPEELLLQNHMSACHSMNFNQILQQSAAAFDASGVN